MLTITADMILNGGEVLVCCEAQARVRQGLARDGSQGERPQSFKPCQELTLKLVATFPPPTHHPPKSLITAHYWPGSCQVRQVEVRGGV